MSCDRFDRYRSGEGTVEEFDRHVRDCAECREQMALEARLDREIAALRGPVADNGLWDRIEASLIREKGLAVEAAGKRAPKRPRLGALGAFLARRWPVLVPAAAAVVLLVVLGLIGLRRPIAPSGILAGEALAKVERAETEYLAAIQSLERQARPKIAAMLSEEMALYEDKLAVIDAQIERCREALASNPGSAHIRRYFLAALRDKRQTLADALGSMK
jgi:hypothetical protein